MATQTIAFGGRGSTLYAGIGHELVVVDVATGDVLDHDDGTFKDSGVAVTPALSMTEDAVLVGLWRADVTIDALYTGVVDILIRDVLADTYVDTRRVHIFEGASLVDLERPKILMHEHTGGFDALQLLAEDGDPIEGGVVRVYLASVYLADAPEENIIGITTTDERGYWNAPIPVAAGASYVVHFHKPSAYGAVAVTVSV